MSSVSRQRNAPEVSTRRQPSPPIAVTTASNPLTASARTTAIRLCRAQAISNAAALKTSASIVNEARRPIIGINTNPVTSTPPTAPSVFHVSKRPTRSPSKSHVSEIARIHKGNTDPSAAAGRPKTKIENIPAATR